MLAEVILGWVLSNPAAFKEGYEDKYLKPNGWSYSRLVAALFLISRREKWVNTPYVEYGTGLLLDD